VNDVGDIGQQAPTHYAVLIYFGDTAGGASGGRPQISWIASGDESECWAAIEQWTATHRPRAGEHTEVLARARSFAVCADDRDLVADERNLAADERNLVADERNLAADERNLVADERDLVADERDLVADERDRIADERDNIADRREASADERERDLDRQQAELDEVVRPRPSVPLAYRRTMVPLCTLHRHNLPIGASVSWLMS
jgi:hypothetical protein